MTPHRWQRVRQLYDEVHRRLQAAREDILAESCAGDPELKQEVAALLAADDEMPGAFLAAEDLDREMRGGVSTAGAVSEVGGDGASLVTVASWADGGSELLGRASTVHSYGEDRLGLSSGIESDFDAACASADDGVNAAAKSPLPQLRSGPHRYQLLGNLGEGGMGMVYFAYDRDLMRNVALKMTQPRDDRALERRFLAEAQVMGQLQHPNILPVLDVGQTENHWFYYTMPLVKGRTLKSVLEGLARGDAEVSRHWPLTRLMQVLIQVGQAVAYAHANGVIHRDLKPANVMLGEHGEVLVLDWGLARVKQFAPITTDLSPSSEWRARLVGTPAYMSPEQAAGGEADERTDVYALGTLLYELLALEPPFAGSAAEIVTSVLVDPPRPLRERAPTRSIPVELEGVCLKALAKLPDERQASVAELLAAIQAWLDAEPAKLGALAAPAAESYVAEHVGQYHDGKYALVLRGDGALALTSDPPGAEAWLYEKVEEGARLRKGNERLLGTTPLGPVPLGVGSYIVILKLKGYRDVRYPVLIAPKRQWTGSVKLYRDAESGHGMIYVPAGPFLKGGDPDCGSTAAQRVEAVLSDFFIGEHPVTLAEYREYLSDLAAAEGVAVARKRAPRTLAEGPSSPLDGEDGWCERLDGESPRSGLDPRWPVHGVSYLDAAAYCAWRTRREGRAYRLPTEGEWEKAARGVDGRWFTWGWRLDPQAANFAESRVDRPGLVAVDEYPADRSVYGVRGLAGNVRDWTGAVDGRGAMADLLVVVRGGAWDSQRAALRCAYRESFASEHVSNTIGFRVASSAAAVAT